LSVDDELLRLMTIAIKLLRMQVMPRAEELRAQLLTTPQQKKAYDALDGSKSIEKIAGSAGYSGTRELETLLPEWESRGFVLSAGRGRGKKYINIENLEV